jgi:hypothetical protein
MGERAGAELGSHRIETVGAAELTHDATRL